MKANIRPKEPNCRGHDWRRRPEQQRTPEQQRRLRPLEPLPRGQARPAPPPHGGPGRHAAAGRQPDVAPAAAAPAPAAARAAPPAAGHKVQRHRARHAVRLQGEDDYFCLLSARRQKTKPAEKRQMMLGVQSASGVVRGGVFFFFYPLAPRPRGRKNRDPPI